MRRRRERQRKRSISRVATLLAAAASVATLAGFAGAWWWVFDLVANLRVQLLVLLTGTALVLATVGPRWRAVIAGAVATVNLWLVLPYLAPSEPAPQLPGGEILSVGFHNVQVGRTDAEAVVEQLRSGREDLVVLTATTAGSIIALDDADLGLSPIMGPHLVSGLEIAVLARHPERFEVAEVEPTADPRGAFVTVSTTIDGRRVRVVATHPVSPLTPARAARRDALLDRLGEYIVSADDPVLLVGDLNATPWSAHLQALQREADLVDSQRTHGLQASWPALVGPFGLPIDHALHTAELTVVTRELGPSLGSWHRSLRVDVGLTADAQVP
jgi:endonuclease/exonuclease/phosphatase (EEP) superfamily protein YafD